ncbi:UNVERIFIED_CONTAM: hypothetical protein K2H54_001621 [Gekko kuhli]
MMEALVCDTAGSLQARLACWVVLQLGEEKSKKQAEMSLSNQPPAPLSEYSPLCKGKSTDGFSEGFHCAETQKDFGKTDFEWQRTEGKLNEIGLNVNSGGQLKDGLGKSTGFTDEDKLCFFEGKLDKELKAAPKDKREIEAQGNNYQATPGHLESWSLISDPFPLAEGSLGSLKIADFHSGPAESVRPAAPLGQNEAITDQEKAAGKKVVEDAKCQPDLPSPSLPRHNGGKYGKEPEISVWNPNFSPVSPSGLGCAETAAKTEVASSYSIIGVVNDGYMESGYAGSPTVPKLGPPVPTVELAQDDFKSGYFSNTHEMEGEKFMAGEEEKLGSTEEEGGFLNRGAHQRKAMRRAMSECSHLSVPQALNLADKYPEPVAREELVTGTALPCGGFSPSASPMTRKPSAPMKRSATVSEEQTSARSPGAAQSNAEPPSLMKEHQSLPAEEPSAKERDGGSSSAKRELASPGLCPRKLEQIPEIGGHGKGGREEEEETVAAKREKSHAAHKTSPLGFPGSAGAGEMEAGRAAVLEIKEIEVSRVPSAPSSQQGDGPRDGMLLNFASSGEQADSGGGADLTDCGQRRVGESGSLRRPTPFALYQAEESVWGGGRQVWRADAPADLPAGGGKPSGSRETSGAAFVLSRKVPALVGLRAAEALEMSWKEGCQSWRYR